MVDEASQRSLLEKPMLRLIAALSIPSIFGMLFAGINTLVDAIYVASMLDGRALAAITIAYPLTQIFNAVASLVGFGAATLLSTGIASNDRRRQSLIIASAAALSVIMALSLSLAVLLTITDVLGLFGIDGQTLDYAEQFMRAFSHGGVFLITALVLNVLIRSLGNMRFAMLTFAIAFGCNVILAPIFISTFDDGLVGAAWANNLSMALLLLMNLRILRGIEASREFLSDFWRQFWAYSLQIFAMGTPYLLLFLLNISQLYIINYIISDIGTSADLAVFGVLNRIFMLALLPVYGMSRAMQPIVSANFGADNSPRVHEALRYFMIIGTLGLASVLGIASLFSHDVMAVFGSSVAPAPEFQIYFWLYALATAFSPIPILSLTYFQAIGRMNLASLLVLIRQVIGFLPLVFIMTESHQIYGIFIALLLSDIIASSAAIFFLAKGGHGFFAKKH